LGRVLKKVAGPKEKWADAESPLQKQLTAHNFYQAGRALEHMQSRVCETEEKTEQRRAEEAKKEWKMYDDGV
jgi:nitrate/TMAO reductase-like tetraheme cytochrome c subunit